MIGEGVMAKGEFDDFRELTVKGAAELMSDGKLTSLQLVSWYINRINSIDKADLDSAGSRTTGINSVFQINTDALKIAEERDKEMAAGKRRGILHGIPVLIKSNIGTADKMPTAAGSIALADCFSKEDSFIVKKLRSSGAVILGKTNMTEWANFIADGMPSGYSSLGGYVRSPFGLNPSRKEYPVGGSSTGSAVAVSSNLTMCAIGTETSGSIIKPATFASAVGIKPTLGLVSRNGIVPLASSQDTAGPICRSVEDAAIMLEVISGFDPEDGSTVGGRPYEGLKYMDYLNAEGLCGKRLGFLADYMEEASDGVSAMVRESLETIKKAGGEIVEIHDFLPYLKSKNPNEKDYLGEEVLFYEFKSDIENYFKTKVIKPKFKTLGEIIQFNEDHKEKALKYGQNVFIESEETKGDLSDPIYINARKRDIEICGEKGLDAVMNQYGLDAVIFTHCYGTGVAARAGYPSICVPAGFNNEDGAISLNFTGKKYSEPQLIEIAYGFEQKRQGRREPEL